MMGHGLRNGAWVALACAAVLALPGCGTTGTSGVYVPPAQQGSNSSISGTVYAPDGQFAAMERWWQWTNGLSLLPRAYAALQGEAPVNSEENVSLSRIVDAAAAAHGSTDGALLLANGRTDPATGQYKISSDALDPRIGRMIVQVGGVDPLTGADLLTRAFVFSCATQSVVSCTADVDAVSEAVVRLVLNFLVQTTAQLGDYSDADLRNIDYSARQLAAARNIPGSSVSEFNDNTYNALANSPTMQTCLSRPQPQQCAAVALQ